MRYTPEDIHELQPNEVFVFGSNEAGMHGGGAAYRAMSKFRARYGVGFGPTGQCFAIPTKDWHIQTLPLEEIKFYVDRFWYFVKYHDAYHFLITKIGCGLAGYKEEDIAPLFADFINFDNVSLPEEFVKIIKNESESIGGV